VEMSDHTDQTGSNDPSDPYDPHAPTSARYFLSTLGNAGELSPLLMRSRGGSASRLYGVRAPPARRRRDVGIHSLKHCIATARASLQNGLSRRCALTTALFLNLGYSGATTRCRHCDVTLVTVFGAPGSPCGASSSAADGDGSIWPVPPAVGGNQSTSSRGAPSIDKFSR